LRFCEIPAVEKFTLETFPRFHPRRLNSIVVLRSVLTLRFVRARCEVRFRSHRETVGAHDKLVSASNNLGWREQNVTIRGTRRLMRGKNLAPLLPVSRLRRCISLTVTG
jgi:hypothetical protein